MAASQSNGQASWAQPVGSADLLQPQASERAGADARRGEAGSSERLPRRRAASFRFYCSASASAARGSAISLGSRLTSPFSSLSRWSVSARGIGWSGAQPNGLRGRRGLLAAVVEQSRHHRARCRDLLVAAAVLSTSSPPLSSLDERRRPHDKDCCSRRLGTCFVQHSVFCRRKNGDARCRKHDLQQPARIS